jgi:hypothetical protein
LTNIQEKHEALISPQKGGAQQPIANKRLEAKLQKLI